jgi:hypothetical protein
MLKFFLSGILASAMISIAYPQASIIIAIIAALALVAIGIEWQGSRRKGRARAKKALPAMKTRKV